MLKSKRPAASSRAAVPAAARTARAGATAPGTDDAPQLEVKTLGKALQILDAVATLPHPPTVSELALSVGLSRPTAYRLVQSLVAADFLQQDQNDARLTIGFSRPAARVEPARPQPAAPRRHAAPAALALRLGARVNLGILRREQVLLLGGVEKPNLPTIYSRFGVSIPLHCSGLGKVILAQLPPERARALLQAQPMTRRTANTITSLPAMVKELGAIRARGFATENAENTPTSSCIAVAILDADSQPVGAVSVSGRSLDALIDRAGDVMATAEMISHLL